MTRAKPLSYAGGTDANRWLGGLVWGRAWPALGCVMQALCGNRSVPQVRLHFLHGLNDLTGGVEVADGLGYAECQPVAHVLEGDPHRLAGYPVVEGRAVVRNPYCLHRPARLGGECAELFLGDLLGPSHGAYVVRHLLRRQVFVAAHSISPFD